MQQPKNPINPGLHFFVRFLTPEVERGYLRGFEMTNTRN